MRRKLRLAQAGADGFPRAAARPEQDSKSDRRCQRQGRRGQKHDGRDAGRTAEPARTAYRRAGRGRYRAEHSAPVWAARARKSGRAGPVPRVHPHGHRRDERESAARPRKRPRCLARARDCGRGKAVLAGSDLEGCGFSVCGYASRHGRCTADGVPDIACRRHHRCGKPAGAGEPDRL